MRLSLPHFEFPASSRIRTAAGEAIPLDWKELSPGEFAASNRLGDWRLRVAGNGSPRVTLTLSGKLHAPVDGMEVILCEVDELPADHVLPQRQNMGGCLSTDLCKASAFNAFESVSLTSVTRNGQTLVISTPLKGEHPVVVKGEAGPGKIRGLAVIAELPHYSGVNIDILPVTLRSGDGFAIFEEYSAENREVDKTFTAPPAGWNSWDYYRWTITEEEVLKNAEFIANDPVLSKHVKRIIVDDGWQYCYGEWEANPRFPSGMAALARELTRMGFEPGLWFAPAVAEPHAHISQVDYDMLAHSEGGQPCLAYECMRRYGFILDPTVPKTEKFLYDLFRRYSDMGYRYFKLDFLCSLLKARRFADASVPRNGLIPKLLEPIYQAVSDRAVILGCNYPFTAGNRLVEAARIGADIHARWHNIKINAPAIAARSWANKKLWYNDPDFALCRSDDTANDPNLHRLKPVFPFIEPNDPFTPDRDWDLVDAKLPQIEILLSMVLMAGGSVNLSDNMPKLNEKGVELARKVVSAESGEGAKALDLFNSELPGRFIQKLKNGHRVLLVNWEDAEKTVEVNLAENGIKATQATDFWNDSAVTISGESLKLTIAPRSCRLLIL